MHMHTNSMYIYIKMHDVCNMLVYYAQILVCIYVYVCTHMLSAWTTQLVTEKKMTAYLWVFLP